MATWSIKGAEIAMAPNGLQNTRFYPEAASSDFHAGQFVRIGLAADTGKDGQLMECAGGADEKVLGIALQDASGVTNALCPVHIIYPGITILRMSVTGANGTDAATTAQTNVGKDASMHVHSDMCLIDGDAIGSNAAYILKIIDICPTTTVGDTYGKYLCTLKAANSQLATA